MFNNIYKNKRVFITGHSGFKGSWLTLWLQNLGAKVCGYSLEPNTNPSMFEELRIYGLCNSEYGNILNQIHLEEVINEFKPEIIFHLAAQPIVRRSYKNPKLTYETNVIGTLNVLEAARKCKSVRAFVNVTTDKCYENKEINQGYKEDDALGGYDMYSSSKACVEILTNSYRNSFLQENSLYALATARAGNIIGGGDWAEDRLIPDCVRYINLGEKIELRNPLAIRPWQYVLDSLSGYLLLGQKLLENGNEYAESFNFGPKEESVLKVSDVAQKVCEYYGKGEIFVQKLDDLHEANLLMLNIEKAEKVLGWTPTYTADVAIEKTVEWYKHFYANNTDMYEFTLNQIEDYEDNVKWEN